MTPPVKSDALVAQRDFMQLKSEINDGKMDQLVFDLCQQEPDLAIAVSSLFEQVMELLKGALMAPPQRIVLDKRVSLAIWLPLLALHRAHRRSWDSCLPSTELVADSPPETAGVPQGDCDGGDDTRGVIVALDVMMMRSLLSDWSDDAIYELLLQNAESLAAAMLKAGATTAVEIAGAEGGGR